MASRNGLNPKIRGPKGVGFGRALPSPFSFGNAWAGNDTGCFSIPAIVGSTKMQGSFSIEFWVKLFNNNNGQALCSFQNALGTSSRVRYQGYQQLIIADNQQFSFPNIPFNQTTHVVFTWNSLTGEYAMIFNSSPMGYTTYQSSYTQYSTQPMQVLYIGGDENGTNSFLQSPFDEFRLYKGILPLDQVASNYANGTGNNPSITENLLAWFQFEKFETLDFSLAQDGSNMQTGVRDMSGNNWHAKPIGLITDPANPNYVLKPF